MGQDDLSGFQKSKILASVGQHAELRPAGVLYIGPALTEVLRQPVMPKGLQTWVVVQDAVTTGQAVQPPAPSSPEQPGKLRNELINAGISCGTTVLAGVATIGSAAAAPVTAGTSTVVTVLSYAALVGGAAQCGMAAGRVYNEIYQPRNNEVLDSLKWYQVTNNILDVIGLLDGVASIGETGKLVYRLSKTSKRPILQVLTKMTRPERVKLSKELARVMMNQQSKGRLSKLAKAGKLPAVYSQVRISNGVFYQLVNTISAEISIISAIKGDKSRNLFLYMANDSGG